MPKKQKTLAKLKKDLDAIFSRYIRLKDSDDNGWVKCVTCLKEDHWSSMDCGHFMSRRHMSTRWDEENTGCQCKKCNIFSQGEQYKYSLYLDNKFYKGKADEIMQKSHTLKKFSRIDIEELIQTYKEEVLIHLDRIGESKS